ncbi:hypothetical protein MDAP_002018 [Mitosporidium daphniae]|uniref:Uncharacterized protein n=1 Tax=Mitosporidium daphniae TaxID=1485682 RepID=A0A098VM89_9MICR|nr:uncharacterized protein DI09_8p190 [Mitosporidium daphniae]KGG50080.1 hypothetical protein DI09_8p190 [Mitosporidium daphniae]|eukprot:XP_013236507.1 uncharacterized protein DI09_8p190 [Mitosporidium daphniae]
MGSPCTATAVCLPTPDSASSPAKKKLSSKITSMKFMQRGLLPSGMSSHACGTSNHPRNRLVAKKGAKYLRQLGRNTKLRRHFPGSNKEETLQ